MTMRREGLILIGLATLTLVELLPYE